MNNIYNVKLTDRDVYHILYLSKVQGLQPYQIEKSFPVSRATIKAIVNGKSRKDCYAAFMDFKSRYPRKVKLLFKYD
ncbi:hypothetical protein [Priestia aryabhattai]|uniref:hypothetical protein n=1 Tax=Priestia aryabhattai TaxID=412384 RepID=UPI000A7E29F3|nr:hypothetical protein [Priestia aryabhattai]